MHPSNLTRKSHTYYARFKIPQKLRAIFARTEIKLSLKTTCYKDACYRILLLKKSIMDLFVMADSLYTPTLTPNEQARLKLDLEHYIKHSLLDCNDIEFLGGEEYQSRRRQHMSRIVLIKLLQKAISSGDFTEPSVLGFVSGFLDIVPDRLTQMFDQKNPDYIFLARKVCVAEIELYKRQGQLIMGREPLAVSLPQTSRSAARPKPTKVEKSPLLSVAIEQFQKDRRDNSISEKSIQDYKIVYSRFVDSVGNKPIATITRQEIRDYRDNLDKFPSRVGKNEKDLPFSELIAMSHPKTLGLTSVNKYMRRVAELFTWVMREDLGVDTNPALNLERANPQSNSDMRHRFSHAQVKAVFSMPVYLGEKSISQSAHYWVPLLGLYVGGRIEELCQLDCTDIQQQDGIWGVSINDDGDKSLKNKSSRRFIPLHSKIIELGLLDYVKSLEVAGHSRLFPSLTRHPRNGYSHNVGQWFTRQKKALKFQDTKESFHSFRHTLVDELKQKEVEEPIVAAIAGHSHGGITSNTYGKAFGVEVLKPYIEMLDFDIHPVPFSRVRLTPTEGKNLANAEYSQRHNERKANTSRGKATNTAEPA